MGLLKKMKDMTDMVNAAPGMVAQAQQMGAQAQQLGAQYQQMAAQRPPAGERMAAMQERMANVSQLMTAQSQAANAAAAAAAAGAGGSAARCPVVITGMRQVGSVNFDLLVEFDLTVTPAGRPPYPATTQQLVSQFQVNGLRAGRTLQAAIDPSNPAGIWLDLGSLA